MNFNIKFIYAALIITIVGGLVAHSLVQHAQDLGDRLDNANQDSSFVKPESRPRRVIIFTESFAIMASLSSALICSEIVIFFVVIWIV